MDLKIPCTAVVQQKSYPFPAHPSFPSIQETPPPPPNPFNRPQTYSLLRQFLSLSLPFPYPPSDRTLSTMQMRLFRAWLVDRNTLQAPPRPSPHPLLFPPHTPAFSPFPNRRLWTASTCSPSPASRSTWSRRSARAAPRLAGRSKSPSAWTA
jgi:hypothetical protein